MEGRGGERGVSTLLRRYKLEAAYLTYKYIKENRTHTHIFCKYPSSQIHTLNLLMKRTNVCYVISTG